MLEKLTIKQRRTFNVVVMHINKNKFPASIRRMRDILDDGVSHIAILDRLKALQFKGYLKKEEGKFIPTGEGIKQYLEDTDKESRIKTIRR